MKNILKFALFLGLGIFIAWWFIKDFATLSRKAGEAQRKTDGKAAQMEFSNRLSAGRASADDKTGTAKKTGLAASIHTRFGDFLCRLAFPRLGDVVRCGFLETYEKIPTAKTLGCTITERVLDMMCFVFLLIIVLILQFSLLSNYAMENFEGLYTRFTNPEFLKKLIIAAIAGILLLAFFLFFLRKRIAHTRAYQKMKEMVLHLWEGLISLKNIKKPWLFVIYTVALWLCYYLMAYIVFYSVEETVGLPLSSGLACLVFGTVGIIVTPGGLGLYPVIIMQILLLYGIAEPIGFALGWLIWSAQNIVIVLGGLAAFILMPIVNRKKDLFCFGFSFRCTKYERKFTA